MGLWLVYLLYFLVVTAPIGFLISMLSARAYKQHWCEGQSDQHEALVYAASHHQWLNTTFISTFFLSMVAISTIGYYLGVIVAAGTLVWWFYRVIKGMVMLTGQHSLPLAIDWPCKVSEPV